LLTGKELKIIRIMKDIEAKEVAKQLGISKSYISLMESGKRNVPKSLYDKWINILN
jgi:transcriptional regulator with XRE-family HTH domain